MYNLSFCCCFSSLRPILSLCLFLWFDFSVCAFQENSLQSISLPLIAERTSSFYLRFCYCRTISKYYMLQMKNIIEHLMHGQPAERSSSTRNNPSRVLKLINRWILHQKYFHNIPYPWHDYCRLSMLLARVCVVRVGQAMQFMAFFYFNRVTYQSGEWHSSFQGDCFWAKSLIPLFKSSCLNRVVVAAADGGGGGGGGIIVEIFSRNIWMRWFEFRFSGIKML